MPLTQHDVERRLKRNESDIIELYGICHDIQRVVRAHDRRFDAVDDHLDGIDKRLDGIDGRLDGIDGRLDALDGRLGSMDSALAELLRRSEK